MRRCVETSHKQRYACSVVRATPTCVTGVRGSKLRFIEYYELALSSDSPLVEQNPPALRSVGRRSRASPRRLSPPLTFPAPSAPKEATNQEVIAAYIRVSTRQQDFSSQKDAIERAARARGEKIERFFAEKRSGSASSREARPVLSELLQAVRAGELSKLYVFRIDRLSRGGIRDTLSVVEQIRAGGCKLATVADDFAVDGPAGDVVLAVMAWAAQMERQALGERISAARDRVEASGGRWGRPRRIDPGTLARAVAMQAAGRTHRAIAVALKVPRSTVSRALAQKGHYADTGKPGQK